MNDSTLCDHIRRRVATVIWNGWALCKLLLVDAPKLKGMRVVEDPDELGYWLEKDDE